MKFQIKSIAGSVLFEGDFTSLAECVLAAVKSKADLRWSNLRWSNLSGSNLSGSDLSGSDLRWSNLSDAKCAALSIARTRILPQGDIIGWKKCAGGIIAKLRIPEAAKRSHAFGRKCRAEYANVVELWDGNKPTTSAKAGYDGGKTVYKVGEIVRPNAWCDDYREECASGIHFFITREEAEAYEL